MKILKVLIILVMSVGVICSSDAEQVKNLIYNSSFELGPAGFELKRLIFPRLNPQIEYLDMQIDSTQAVEGKVSMKIDNSFADYFRFISEEVILMPGKKYYISLWIKSSIDKYPLRIIFESVGQGKKKWNHRLKHIKVSKTWKKYRLEIEVPSNNKYYNLRVESDPKKNQRAGIIWIDAMQISENKSDTYQPRNELEAAIYIDKKVPLFKLDEAITGKLKIINYNSPPIAVQCKFQAVNDYTKKKAKPLIKHFTAAPGRLVEKTFNFTMKSYGGYTLNAAIIEPQAAGGKVVPAHFAITPEVAQTLTPVDSFNPGINATFYATLFLGVLTGHDRAFSTLGCLDDTFKYYARQGIRWIRDWGEGQCFAWSYIEPERGKFNWTETDRIVALCQDNNIRILPVLGGDHFLRYKKLRGSYYSIPDWVIKRGKTAPHPYSNLSMDQIKLLFPKMADWENYIYNIVNRYKGVITHYEIMNEPALSMHAKDYIRYLKTAYKAAKKADPNCKIVGFSATGDKGGELTKFLDECFNLGGLDYVDIISFHPYRARLLASLSPADEMIKEINRLVKKYSDKPKPIWNTELYYLRPYRQHDGYLDGLVSGNEAARRFFIDLAGQVQRSIAPESYFTVKSTVFRNRRTTRKSTKTNLIPSFLFVINATLAQRFEGATFVEQIAWSGTNVCYVFKKDTKLTAVVWNYNIKNDPALLKLELPTAKIVITDMFGNKIASNRCNELKLSNDPLYIHWHGGDSKPFLTALKNAQIIVPQAIDLVALKMTIDNHKPVIACEIENKSPQPQAGYITIKALPRWLTAEKTSVKYGPIAAYEKSIIYLPVILNNRQKTAGNVQLAISTNTKIFKLSAHLQSKKLATCVKLKTAPIIDGTLAVNEYQPSQAIIIADKSQLKNGQEVDWQGDKDCSVIIKTAYDNTNLYLAITVNDDIQGERFIKNALHTGDSIEVFIHTTADGGKRYTKNSYQMTFGLKTKKSARGNAIRTKGRKIEPKLIKWQGQYTAAGYIMEIAIPFTVINLDGSNLAGKAIDFDIAVNDADKGKRESQLIWSGGAKSFMDRSEFGILRFQQKDNDANQQPSNTASKLLNNNTIHVKQNLIKNSNFAAGKKSWHFGRGWEISSLNGYNYLQFDNSAKNANSAIVQNVPIEKKVYYRYSFEHKILDKNNTLTDGNIILAVNGKQNNAEHKKYFISNSKFDLTAKWQQSIDWFYTGGDDTNVNLALRCKVEGNAKILIAKLRLEKHNTLHPGVNYLQGTFEHELAGWFFYHKWERRAVKGNYSFDKAVSCPPGTISIKLDTTSCSKKMNATAMLRSVYLPVIPGKTHILEFWAKAKVPNTKMLIIIDAWSPPMIKPHWYKKQNIGIDTALKKYSIKFTIPAISDYPILNRRAVFLKIGLEKTIGTLWLDNITFEVK